jgi:multidrug efflux pump subunit AcrB
MTDDDRPTTRQRVLDAALRCFGREGSHGASMQQICAEAGVSPGALYRYFRSKDDLIVALVEADREHALAMLHAALDRADPRDGLRALDETLAQAERVAEAARAELAPDEARSVYAQAGIKFTDVEPLYGDPYGQVQISLNPRTGDMRTTSEVVEAMRAKIESLPGPSRNSFFIVSGGPPRERPINVKVRSDDPSELRAAADAVKAIAERIPGARDVVDDDVAGRAQLVLTLNREAIAAAGIDPARVQRLIRLHGGGEIVADLRVAGEKLEVRVRAPERRFEDVTQLLADPISLPGGGITTLGALVDYETATGRGLIRRHQLRRTIMVLGDLNPGTTDTVQAARSLREGWERVRAQYPGADLDFSGELEDIQESLSAMPRHAGAAVSSPRRSGEWCSVAPFLPIRCWPTACCDG